MTRANPCRTVSGDPTTAYRCIRDAWSFSIGDQ